jgi:acyl-CoA synthetase (AMP-forming)/AMP-acid ligase II
MEQSTTADPGVAAVYRDDPRLAPLIGPGAPFEVEPAVVDGIEMRDFVRAPRTIVDVFAMGDGHGDLVHVVYESERWTHAEVRRRARGLAHELRETFGVRPGDRVGIAMRNLPEYVVAFWGAALNGAIVVPLNAWWAGGELDYALRDAGVTVLFADDERIERVLADGRPDGLQIIGVRTDRGDVALDDLTDGDAIADNEIARLERDDPIVLMYTSGTTGRPKGALITNRAMIANLWNMAFAAARESLLAGRTPPPPRQSASIAAAPMFHIGGVSSMVGGPMGGSKIVIMRKWDADVALRLAREEQVTGFGGVPTMARQILEHPRITELGVDVRSCPMGGAAVPPDLPLRAVEVFGPGVQILNGYGGTETTSAVVTNVGIEYEARPGSVGRPNLTGDVKIVDAEGATLGVGEIGEICMRGPQVVPGYWNDEVATAAAFRDGWFHSGDVGYLDGEGFLYVVDRLKDVVIRGGENVYCVEVEAVLHEYPAVADVAVVGIDERVMGERVCAVVVPRAGATVELADLRAFATDRLAAFKRPEALYLVDELPTTATGKIAKRELRAQIAADDSAVERVW